MNLNFNMEYQQDVIIEGVGYVLNNVENLLCKEGTLIRRIYISADGKQKKAFEQVIPHPPKAPAPDAAPAAEAPEAPAAEEKPEPKAEKKPGFFSKAFNKSKKDRK
jgi:hypothetical protein